MPRTERRVVRHKLRTGESVTVRQFINARGQTVVEVSIVQTDIDRLERRADTKGG